MTFDNYFLLSRYAKEKGWQGGVAITTFFESMNMSLKGFGEGWVVRKKKEVKV